MSVMNPDVLGCKVNGTPCCNWIIYCPYGIVILFCVGLQLNSSINIFSFQHLHVLCHLHQW